MIAEIRLQQYRSYKDQTIKLKPGVNIVVGPNASGKTNLLEAVMVICQGSSYRAPDSELIMHNKDWARIDALTDNGPRTVKITAKPKISKEFVINNKSFRQLRADNQLPVVLFEPNHLLMLSGSPELRRNYLDNILEVIKPGYKKSRKDYLKTLRHRNALLKSGRANNSSELFPWDVRLSHLGGVLAVSRDELTQTLNKTINRAYSSIANTKDKISLSYKSAVSLDAYESLLLKKLEMDYELDVIRGFTAHGPHREDLEIYINKKHPSSVASRGEARSITISLKTIEYNLIKSQTGQSPIVLLDDVFSELDESRAKQLIQILKDKQAIVTSTALTIGLRSLNHPHIIKTV